VLALKDRDRISPQALKYSNPRGYGCGGIIHEILLAHKALMRSHH
jgi:hypothetical protein